jgi:hypothetical protein
VHAPALQPSPDWPHPAPQACPIDPHVPAATGAHIPASVQQLFGHEPAVQMHAPFEHTWPAAHAPPCPHWQTPPELQLLAEDAWHTWQLAPWIPQLPNNDVSHVVPEQHPAQEPAVHWQLPFRQTCPATHSLFPPHVHAPAVQPSASDESHIPQPTPSVPHAPTDGVSHVSPEQHPFAQFAGEHPLQTPPLEHFPPGQVWHVEPPVPHAVGDVPVTHVLPEQQPFGHDVALQTQLPFEHVVCPATHAVPPPQVHTPAVLQPSPV